MGAAHFWNSQNDFEYCTLTNCKYDAVTSSVVLDNSLSGTILSDVRDSTDRLIRYDEIIPKIVVPTGTTAQIYVRCGAYWRYTEDTWTDWRSIEVTDDAKIVELTLSLANNKIVTDYEIAKLYNIFYSADSRSLQLAMNLTEAFINALDDYQVATLDQYQILWAAFVDSARVGFAKTDYVPGAASQYAIDASYAANVIKLKNKLPLNNAPCVVEYVPRHFVYIGPRYRYFQWKCEFTAAAGATSPALKEVVAKYTLNFQSQIENAFPKFFRRL